MKHEIKTLTDILRVVSADNLEHFLTDFRGLLTAWVLLRTATEATEPEKLEEVIAGVKATYVEDGKHDLKITRATKS